MSFKQTFIEKVRLIYKDSVIESNVREATENLIANYFLKLQHELSEEIDVSDGELSISHYQGEYLEITLDQRELKFDFESTDIELNIKYFDFQKQEEYEKQIDRLEFTENGFKSRFFFKLLDDDLLEHYLQIAFDEELDRLLENPAF